MRRRELLTTLGLGAVALGSGNVFGQNDASQQTTTTTTDATTTVPTTHTTSIVNIVPSSAHLAFKETYEAYLADDDPQKPVDTYFGLSIRLSNQFPTPDLDGRAVETGEENEAAMVARIPRDGSNKVQVAELAAHSAGLVAQESIIYDSLDVSLLMLEPDAPNDGDDEAQATVNQTYRIEGSWIEAFVNGDWQQHTLLHEIIRTQKTVNETPTPTPYKPTTPDPDEWTFESEVAGNDGTLTLIEGGLEGGYTLWAEYDSAATYVYGVVENVSGSTLSYAEVQGNLYLNDALMTRALANVTYLPAGDRWRFVAAAPEPVRFDYVNLYLSGRT